MSAGVFVECHESVGPVDFDCWNVASSYSGLTVGYYVSVPTSYKCSHGKSAEYRPIATRLSVQGRDYPDVVGNVVLVDRG